MMENLSARLHVFCAMFLVIAAKTARINGAQKSMTFELPDNENFCFYEEFDGAKRYVFEYDVLAGGLNDVDASVKSPNGKILYKETKQNSDEFVFESSRGTYEFCFSNEFSTFTHKIVYFSLGPELQKTLAEEGGDEKPTVNTQSEESLEAIHLAATNTVKFQTDYRLNEARGRHMAELLNKRVQWWSIFESCIILVTGIGQVFVLRAFFTTARTSLRAATGGAGVKAAL